jgi:hypothetical protein
MGRFGLILLATLILAQGASAWGPQAQETFCRQAVSAVWGQEAVKCLDQPIEYCIQLRQMNESIGRQCLDAYAQGVQITPATAPMMLFNDEENSHNFDNCPLEWLRPGNDWICSGSGNPALENARMWFEAARTSHDMCQQVRLFCTGAYYFASSYDPLLRVKYLKGCVNGPLDVLVDGKLLSGESDWSVKEQCTFSYMKQLAGVSRVTTQHVTFIIGEADLDAVTGNLTIEAGYVRNPALMPPTTTLQPTSATQPAIMPATSTTLATQTPLSCPPSQPTDSRLCNPQVQSKLDDMDTMLADIASSMDTAKAENKQSYGIGTLLIVAALIVSVAVSLVLLAYYARTLVLNPSAAADRRIVLPPSFRRKAGKAE